MNVHWYSTKQHGSPDARACVRVFEVGWCGRADGRFDSVSMWREAILISRHLFFLCYLQVMGTLRQASKHRKLSKRQRETQLSGALRKRRRDVSRKQNRKQNESW